MLSNTHLKCLLYIIALKLEGSFSSPVGDPWILDLFCISKGHTDSSLTIEDHSYVPGRWVVGQGRQNDGPVLD